MKKFVKKQVKKTKTIKLPVFFKSLSLKSKQKAKKHAPWYVYMVRCANKTFYTGISNDVKKRVKAHNTGTGARYTRANGPVKLIYTEKHPDKSTAMKREHEIKTFSKKRKRALLKK